MSSQDRQEPEPGTVGEHLRAALLELIAAGRAVLDVAEQLVSPPPSARAPTRERPKVERIVVEDGRTAD